MHSEIGLESNPNTSTKYLSDHGQILTPGRDDAPSRCKNIIQSTNVKTSFV